MFAADGGNPQPPEPDGCQPRGPAAANADRQLRLLALRLDLDHEYVRKSRPTPMSREIAEGVAGAFAPREYPPESQELPAKGIVRQDQIDTLRRPVAHQRDLIVKGIDC